MTKSKVTGNPAGKEAYFRLLDEGTYYLKEKKVPAGYTLLANPIKVKIEAVETDGLATGQFKLYVNDEEVSVTTGDYNAKIDVANGLSTVAVENHKGFSLPATGGMGIVLFLLVMDYPFLARLWNEAHQAEVIAEHDASMYRQEDTEKEETLKAARAYNESLASGLGQPGLKNPGSKRIDPLGEAVEEAAVEQAHRTYEALLNSGEDGIMGTLEIPKIKVYLAVYHGTEEETLQKGAGHLEGSSLPVGGESTHACISAHRGLVQKKMFTNLDQMEKGDVFLLHILGDTLSYRVCDIRVVKPDEVESLGIQRGEDVVTLITCTPYGLNTHRLLVEGERIAYTPEVEKEIAEAEEPFSIKDWWWAGVSLLLLVLMAVLLVRYLRSGN